MKTIIFSKRVAKEILRDPLTLFFGLVFPLVLLLLMTAIQSNVPVPIFEIQTLTPGICVFGLSFMTLFSATLVSKDRSSSYISRLYTTPLTAVNYILGYTLPFFPIAVAQSVICYSVAMLLGLTPSVNIIFAIISTLPAVFFFISLGLLCGTLLTDKQVGGICGAMVTNLTAFLSGAWLDLAVLGDFGRFAYVLPFAHATELGRGALSGRGDGLAVNISVILAYAAAISALSVFCFRSKMKKS